MVKSIVLARSSPNDPSLPRLPERLLRELLADPTADPGAAMGRSQGEAVGTHKKCWVCLARKCAKAVILGGQYFQHVE